MSSAARGVLAGAVAGFAATAPMTAAMRAVHCRLPPHQRDPLPPKQVTVNAAEVVGVRHKLSPREKHQAFQVAHYAFGTTAGAVYGALAPHLAAPGMVTGVGYALTVWATHYLGLLPSAGLYKAPDEEPPGRHGMLIAAHVVWGAALGALTDLLLLGREDRR
jgi:hypothetical protein